MNNESQSQANALTALEQRQHTLSIHVRMVARRLSHALFVFGAQGGLGKTRTILQTLDEEGVDPVLINSHVTPLALYEFMHRYKEDSVLFFDDTDGLFASSTHLGLLRSALWGSPRIVCYGSSKLPPELPERFEFTSRCIFAANVIPKKNDAFNAVLSRCDVFQLSATNDEVIELMRDIAANGFRGITAEECETVIDYIAEHSGERELSLRLLTPSLRKFFFARQENLDWRPLIKSQLQTLGRKTTSTKLLDSQSKDLRCLLRAIEKHPGSANDQMNYWCEQTGKSRASFYRILSKHRAESGDQ